MISARTAALFHASLSAARLLSPLVADATSSPAEIGTRARFYLSDDGASGFGIAYGGTLVGLFSLVRGQGDALVRAAVEAGATNLDCFDGYLPTLYARHGFTEVDRVPNWTPGGPDVVFMSLSHDRTVAL